MKYAYAILAAMLMVGASSFPLSLTSSDLELNELDHDIIDFIRLIPEDEFVRVIEEHGNDPELWKSIAYLLSDDFHNLVYAAEDLHEFHRYVLYLQKAGYDAIRELRHVHEALGMKEYVPPKEPKELANSFKKGGGYSGLVDDLLAILPKKEIKALHERKLKESPAFAKFAAAVRSPTFTEIKSNLVAQKAMQNLFRESKAHGIDYHKFYSLRYTLLGFA